MYEKERPTPWPYDRGLRRNWEEVMGRRWGLGCRPGGRGACAAKGRCRRAWRAALPTRAPVAIPPPTPRSKLSWLLPRHTPEERARLLDSCIGQRLLAAGGDSAV